MRRWLRRQPRSGACVVFSRSPVRSLPWLFSRSPVPALAFLEVAGTRATDAGDGCVCVFLRGGGAAVQGGLDAQEGVQLPSRIARVAAQVATCQTQPLGQVAAHGRAFTSERVWHLETPSCLLLARRSTLESS